NLDISASGNVGIGTASPAAKLHVHTGTDENLWVRSISGLDVTAALDSGSNFVKLNLNASPLLINAGSGGNVGIGTTSPDQKLSVQGDADKSAGGTSWGVFSDERLKDIKGSYSRGLSAVMGLRPVRFSY